MLCSGVPTCWCASGPGEPNSSGINKLRLQQDTMPIWGQFPLIGDEKSAQAVLVWLFFDFCLWSLIFYSSFCAWLNAREIWKRVIQQFLRWLWFNCWSFDKDTIFVPKVGIVSVCHRIQSSRSIVNKDAFIIPQRAKYFKIGIPTLCTYIFLIRQRSSQSDNDYPIRITKYPQI